MSFEHKQVIQFPDLAQNYLFPGSQTDLSQMISNHSRLRIGGFNPYRYSNSKAGANFAKAESGKLVRTEGPPTVQQCDGHVLLDKLNKVVMFSPADQVITVEAGILLNDLNKYLLDSGFEIPIGLNEKDQEECIGDLMAMNLPHWNLARGGTWRDWVVKMRIVLANGEIVTSGADVVKSVSGFDIHKLMIGARFTLGVISEVTLRIKPRSTPKDYPAIALNHGILFLTNREGLKELLEYSKCHTEDDDEFVKHAMVFYIEDESCLVLTESFQNHFNDAPFDSAKFGHVWRSHVGEFALPNFSESDQKLMRRTKAIFDPTNKLNPGEFGFF